MIYRYTIIRKGFSTKEEDFYLKEIRLDKKYNINYVFAQYGYPIYFDRMSAKTHLKIIRNMSKLYPFYKYRIEKHNV